MAQLVVRKLESTLVDRLRARAAKHGRSMEAEHREILKAALDGSARRPSLKDWLRRMPNAGRDQDFARASSPPRRVDL